MLHHTGLTSTSVTANLAPFTVAKVTDRTSVNVTLASQYISRGFRQGWGKPALQGGADYAHPSGWSVGTWMSSVSNRFIENGTLPGIEALKYANKS